ncbi:HD-GYP domain-containing protein [Parasphingorhabdus cellanae]|uniref:HD-GYP domain-containing protein n=2 Tax=Parasphingorhabdus cellanae TaxID=2806553 RepID=A0ABX7T0X7_9SPHN|nr:HD-GYP domain-containing protein [Parasphingorhabdus cellanae]
MFIDSLECSWLESPFWRSRFPITDAEQLETLLSSDVYWVQIDDSKGKGLPGPSSPQSQVRVETPTHVKTVTKAAPSPAVQKRPAISVMERQEIKRLSPRERAAEMRRASTTIKRSREDVMTLFEDARLGNSVKSEKMAPLVERISNSVDIDPSVILNMARLKTKDEYTYLHSVAVCALMINLGRKLRLPEAQIHDIGMAGMLHDVGKTSIPDSILLKPGKLEDAEWTTVRDHPQRGHDILSASEGVSDIALEVCLRHHEKMDGTGYPGKMEADDLSIFTRMSSICDVYDALTSQRPYNVPLSASQALAKMQSWSGHFDQLILRDFVDSLGILPVGTLVKLDHNELAIVIGESPTDFAAPIVRSFHSMDKDRAIAPQDIDTGRKKSRKVLSIEDPEDWNFSDWSNLSAKLLTKQM